MTSQDAFFFSNLYFANYDELVKFAKEDIPKVFIFKVPEGYQSNNNEYLSITISDILKMSYDVWHLARNKEVSELSFIHHNAGANPTFTTLIIQPASVFSNILKLLKHFNIDLATYIVDYHPNISLQYVQYGCEWIDEEDFEEYLQKGYRKIDLDLINAEKKRNNKKVLELLALGANLNIDPFDESNETCLDNLCFDAYYLSSEYMWQWQDPVLDIADERCLFDALKSLYCAASANDIYNTINNYVSII